MGKTKKPRRKSNCKKSYNKAVKQENAWKENIGFATGIISFIFALLTAFFDISNRPTIPFKCFMALTLMLSSGISIFFCFRRKNKATNPSKRVICNIIGLISVLLFLYGALLFLKNVNSGQEEINRENPPQQIENNEQQILKKAELYYEGGLYEDVIDLYSSETLLENPVVLNNLGYMYSKGIHFNQDFDTAIYYYELATEKGSGDAFHNLISLRLHNCKTFDEVVSILNEGYYGGDNGTFLFLGSILQGEELSETTMTNRMRTAIEDDIDLFFALDCVVNKNMV